MRFYTQQHKYYCGIDLHARKMFVCIMDQKGKIRIHENIKTDPQLLFELVIPYLDDVVVGVECVFCWYWVADLCAVHQIEFVLGHALYMKAIHGGKQKTARAIPTKSRCCSRAAISRSLIHIRPSGGPHDFIF